MSELKQLFSASLAKDSKFCAHTIRIKKDSGGSHDLHTTGLHRHLCDFQMFYVLNGRIKFVHETKAVRQIPETAAAAR